MKTLPQMVDFLNDMLAVDPLTITTVMTCRFECSDKFDDHPGINVRKDVDNVKGTTLSALGIINGMLGHRPDGWGQITAELDDNGLIKKFMVTDRGT